MKIILFLHVLSAFIWVGGMIAIRFAVHYAIDSLEAQKKLHIVTQYLNNFFKMVIPSILIILITAIIMIKEFNLNGNIVYLKELVFTIMSINFIFIFIKRNKAQKFVEDNNLKLAKQELLPIANIMIPLNIILGIVALFLGVTLRGF